MRVTSPSLTLFAVTKPIFALSLIVGLTTLSACHTRKRDNNRKDKSGITKDKDGKISQNGGPCSNETISMINDLKSASDKKDEAALKKACEAFLTKHSLNVTCTLNNNETKKEMTIKSEEVAGHFCPENLKETKLKEEEKKAAEQKAKAEADKKAAEEKAKAEADKKASTPAQGQPGPQGQPGQQGPQSQPTASASTPALSSQPAQPAKSQQPQEKEQANSKAKAESSELRECDRQLSEGYLAILKETPPLEAIEKQMLEKGDTEELMKARGEAIRPVRQACDPLVAAIVNKIEKCQVKDNQGKVHEVSSEAIGKACRLSVQ